MRSGGLLTTNLIRMKKYKIIYADPAWKYNDKQNTPKLGGAVKHYQTMTIKELCNLPVKCLTEDNAVLFIWTTSPLLEETFAVIKAWGFKYKSSFVWDKIKHNMGHYNSVRHELLLICTKGSCTPEIKKLFDSVVSIGGISGLGRADYVGKVYTHKYPETIIEYSSRAEKRGLHPTQKPLELMKYLIKTYSNENDMVLDNTMGSGTTCLAAKELNRKFIGIEKEPKYYEIACQRCGF